MIWISIILILGLLSGCKGELTVSSEEIISNVLDDKGGDGSYYAEGIMKMTSGGEAMEDISFKEYAGADGKRKVISTDHLKKINSYTVNDGKKLLSYEDGSKQALSMDIADGELPAAMTQKEQVTSMLEAMKDTHKYEMAGEERIFGFDTYHVKLKAKTKDSILGDMEMWVDQKTWFVVKSFSQSGDVKTEIAYKKLDFSPKFDSDTFTLELPEDVKITKMESEFGAKTGSIADAEKALGKPFLVFQDQDITVDQVEIDELKGEINRTEVTVTYVEQNIPAFLVSVFPTPEGKGMKIKKGKWTVRGQNAEYEKIINGLTWDEGGMRYSLLILNPDLKVEDAVEMTKGMKLSSE
jgi:outer membrane lipoprotein-sorting protein